MSEPNAVYQVQKSGFWNTKHVWTRDGQPVGVLTIRRNAWGLTVGGRYVPEKGEVLTLRRDPGLLRSQFSLWTEGREWLCSSLRPGTVARKINLETGGKPLRMVPLAGLRCGWTVQAPKTGERARLRLPLVGKARVEVYQKIEMELVVLSYFLGAQLRLESLPPGPAVDSRGKVIVRSGAFGT